MAFIMSKLSLKSNIYWIYYEQAIEKPIPQLHLVHTQTFTLQLPITIYHAVPMRPAFVPPLHLLYHTLYHQQYA